MRKFAPKDLEEMNSWYLARGMGKIDLQYLPMLGYIEPGVAAGFLYRTDSVLGFIDGLISNSTISSSIRGNALSAIGDQLLLDAAQLGIKHVLVYTKHPGVARWAGDHHFIRREDTSLYSREV